MTTGERIKEIRNKLGIILVLNPVGIELILAGGADAGIGCDTQLSRDDLVVRRNYDDPLLFQRKISITLLFCHVVHLLAATHYYNIRKIAMTKTEKNQA